MNASWHWCCCGGGLPRVALMTYRGIPLGTESTVLQYFHNEGSILHVDDITSPYSADSLSNIDVVIHPQAGLAPHQTALTSMPTAEALALKSWLQGKVERRLYITSVAVESYVNSMMQQLDRELRVINTTTGYQRGVFQDTYLSDELNGLDAYNLNTSPSFTYKYIDRLAPFRSDYIILETYRSLYQVLENDYGDIVDGVWGVNGGSVIVDTTNNGLFLKAAQYVNGTNTSDNNLRCLQFTRNCCTLWNPIRI
jgi:hypothetical protein